MWLVDTLVPPINGLNSKRVSCYEWLSGFTFPNFVKMWFPVWIVFRNKNCCTNLKAKKNKNWKHCDFHLKLHFDTLSPKKHIYALNSQRRINLPYCNKEYYNNTVNSGWQYYCSHEWRWHLFYLNKNTSDILEKFKSIFNPRNYFINNICTLLGPNV